MTHHHHAGEPHPAPTLTLSLLRLSVAQRLGVAAALSLLVWAAVLWAMQ